MKKNKYDRSFDRCLFVGVACLIMLIITSFLPGLSDSKDYTAVGNTWGLEYYKEFKFLGRGMGIRSFVMFIWLGLLIYSIYEYVKGNAERENQIIGFFIISVLGLILLARTYDYANDPSKLVFGHNKKVNAKFKNLSLKNDTLINANQISSRKSKAFESFISEYKSRANDSIRKSNLNVVDEMKIEKASFLGIEAKRVTYNKQYSLEYGFWLMFAVVLVQLGVAFLLLYLKPRIEIIE